MTKQTNDRKTIWVFTPSRTNPKDLEFILVQRQALLQDAVERVKESALTPHKHHLLFVGPRGCGKTHLVTLIVNRLSEAEELKDRLRIAWLNEDETCTTLLELLVKIHGALEKRYPHEYREEMLNAAYELKPEAALEFVSKHLLAALGSRTLLVVTENLDAIFEGLGDAGQKQFRSFIQENSRLAIVATAQRLVEDLSNRNSPFFGFFQTEHLKPLNVEQATELLQNIAQLQEQDGVCEFLATSRGRSRVRAIHHLSGGNHRIYIVLSQFITRDSVEALLEPFMKMVDELTPYYQERIRWLSPLQRKIVEYLCVCEGTVPVKEIAKRLFATSSTISSQLQDLREKGYVEANQRGRESLYEISEPLMRICVEVKDNQRRQPLRLLVDFLRVWYDDQELKHRLSTMEPASASCEYLQSAIQRNSTEGNLRMKLMLDELGFVAPNSISRKAFAELTSGIPEGLLVATRCLKEGDKTGALLSFNEAIELESDPAKRALLMVGRGLLFANEGQRAKAIADFTAVIDLPNAPVGQVAMSHFYRGIAQSEAGDLQCAIADFTAVIDLPNAPVEQVAKALVNRGSIQGEAGDSQRAIADFTAVIDLPNAPVEQVAKALVNRGSIQGEAGDLQRAIADFTAVIDLPNAPVEQVGRAHFNRGIDQGKAGDLQRAIADFTAVIDLPNAPAGQVAMSLVNRGCAQGEAGDSQRAIADFTAVIDLPNAPVEQVAMALVNRGSAQGRTGDLQRAIADLTTVINLPGAPVEQVVMAYFNRGNAYSNVGDTHRAITDYTAVVRVSGVPTKQVAMALINRGIAYGEAGDLQRCIADLTTVIDLPRAPVELVAVACFNRGIAHGEAGDLQRAITDFTSVIGATSAMSDQVAEALYLRGVIHLQNGRKPEAQADFEALVCLPEAPLEKVAVAYLALAELQFSEGRWSEGFQSLEASLESGAKVQPVYRGTASDLIGTVFSAGLNPDGRRDKVTELLRIHAKHQSLPVLGEAVVKHIGSIFRAGAPFASADNLEDWAAAWEQAAESVPDFRLSVRLLRTGIDFVKVGGNDPGVLLALTAPERAILEQALGLAEKDTSKTT